MEIDGIIIERQIYNSASQKSNLKLWIIVLFLVFFGLVSFCVFCYHSNSVQQESPGDLLNTTKNLSNSSIENSKIYTTKSPKFDSTTTIRVSTTKSQDWNPV